MRVLKLTFNDFSPRLKITKKCRKLSGQGASFTKEMTHLISNHSMHERIPKSLN